MSAEQSPRELTPIQKFWTADGQPGFKNYSPAVTKIDQHPVPIAPVPDQAELEALEVEEVLTPTPKASDALEAAALSGSIESTVPPESETPALPVSSTPTESSHTDADLESGKGSDVNAPVPPTPNPPSPSPVPFTPSSSTPPMPTGVSVPPVSAQPPTKD